ncbi:MAG: DUF370 domain-containing protein [Clostridia bacterium]
MYLNIGKDMLILKENIIGIFDFDNATTSKISQKFLINFEKNKKITYVIEDLPKSFILYNINEESHVFVSEYSSKTLQKRMEGT